MRSKKYAIIGIILLVLLWDFACAPRTSPTSVTPVSTPIPQTTSISGKTMDRVPEVDAWEKVLTEARKEGKVTLYTFNFTGDIGKNISKVFNDKYGIKVELVTGIASVLIERIKTERRAQKYIADTIDTAPTLLAMAKDDGLTTAIGDIPSLRERDIWVMLPPKADPEGHIIGLRSAPYPTWVNTTLVKPGNEPRSYKDLLESKWKGKITLDSPVTSPLTIYVYLATRKAGTLDDDFWRRLSRQELKVGPSTREPLSWLARGEVEVHMATSDAMMAPYLKEGAPIRAIEMVEGVPIVTNSAAISLIKDGPHSNAARVFVNWLTSREGQDFYAQTIGGFYPLRKDTPDIRPTALRVEMKKPLVMDFASVLEVTKMQREGTLAKILGLEK